MYETRQNKEKVSRRIDGGGTKLKVCQEKDISNAVYNSNGIGTIQFAGHGNVLSLESGSKWLVKFTSEREAKGYEFLGNKSSISKYVICEIDNGVASKYESASVNDADNLVQSLNNNNSFQEKRQNYKYAIIMENLINGDMEFENNTPHTNLPTPKKFDIKIGYTTVSKAELEKRGHESPTLKKNKLRIADFLTGSYFNGYRFCDGTEREFHQYIQQFNAYENIKNRLDSIKSDMGSDLTFIAASVFIAFTSNGYNVKLIDLDHPMKKDEYNDSKFNKYKHNFDNGIDKLKETIGNTNDDSD